MELPRERARRGTPWPAAVAVAVGMSMYGCGSPEGPAPPTSGAAPVAVVEPEPTLATSVARVREQARILARNREERRRALRELRSSTRDDAAGVAAVPFDAASRERAREGPGATEPASGSRMTAVGSARPADVLP